VLIINQVNESATALPIFTY